MRIGTCLPKLRRINPDIINLAKQFQVVAPLDWLCPSTLVFDGVTTQHDIIKALRNTDIRGHALIPCKDEYVPTIWGGRCRGKDWAGQKVNLALDQKKSLMLNHVINTIRRFPSVKKWDLMTGNVKPNGQLRYAFLEELLNRAIIADPNKKYYLDELLCTTLSRWKTIFSLASRENIAGVGIQVHVHNGTNLDETFKLLEKVLKLAIASNISIDLSEVGYWITPDTEPDEIKLKRFTTTIKRLAEDYNVKDFIWWGLVPYCQTNLQNDPKIVAMYDGSLNPTIVYDILING